MSKPLQRLLRPLAAAMACLLAAFSVSAALPSTSPQLTSTLGVMRASRIQAILEGNPEPLVAPCTGSTRLMTEGLPTVIGSANIEAYFRAFFARFTVRAYVCSDVQTWDLGARVAEFGRFTLQLAPKAGGAELSLQGKYLDLWEHDSGSGLRLAVIASNFDAWMPNGDILRFDGIPYVRVAMQARVPLDNDLSVELAAYNLLMQRALIEHDAALWSRIYAQLHPATPQSRLSSRLIAANSPFLSSSISATTGSRRQAAIFTNSPATSPIGAAARPRE